MDERLESGPGHRTDDAADLGRRPFRPVEVDDAPDHQVRHRVQRRLLEDELAVDRLVDPRLLGLLAVDEQGVLVEDTRLLAGR
jgi:hypothetical protein